MIKITQIEYNNAQNILNELATTANDGVAVSKALCTFANDLIFSYDSHLWISYIDLLEQYNIEVYYDYEEDSVYRAIKNAYATKTSKHDIKNFQDYVQEELMYDDVYGIKKQIKDKVAIFPIDTKTALDVKKALQKFLTDNFIVEKNKNIIL